MSEQLYERYKDALRRGHLAALRGPLDVAAEAYREAAEIAPDRALPYVGLGGVLARLGQMDEALAAYAAALERAPTDEAAMRGRADVLAGLGRRAEAAETLDRLAASLERDDRLVDACDVARTALELAESRGRRRELESLVARLRASTGDTAADEALARALGVLETVHGAAIGGPAGGESDADGSGAADVAGDQAPPEPVDPILLTLAVETALEVGDLDEARRQALVAAAAHRAVGQYHAAMDVCYQALAIAPADPDIHLALAELYIDRGWSGPAADKLVLLGRLSTLTGDAATRARICSLAVARFPGEPRLAALCA